VRFENIFFAIGFIFAYLCSLLSVIRPLTMTTGILFFFAIWTKLGQTSSSMSMQMEGLSFLKVCFLIAEKSKGKKKT